MPTPFTHLHTAQRLLRDDFLPTHMRAALHEQLGAFLLGNVAADARSSTGERANTHFYRYDQPIRLPVWREMLSEFPTLTLPLPADQRAFVAGYVAHLAMDEIWTLELVRPHIVEGVWGDLRLRFYAMHLLLILMDERDLAALEAWQSDALISALPRDWLPFISDHDLCGWRDLIYQQITPGGVSLTLNIFGGRVGKTPEELRADLESNSAMQSTVWDHVPRAALAQIEAQMYAHAREQIAVYWSESET